jgi:hypothetical protein
VLAAAASEVNAGSRERRHAKGTREGTKKGIKEGARKEMRDGM